MDEGVQKVYICLIVGTPLRMNAPLAFIKRN